MEDPLTIGYSGQGTLAISGGGQVSSTTGHVGFDATGSGTVTVEGPGSSWTNTSDLDIGRSGTGHLTITDGGNVSNRTGYLGRLSGSTGTMSVVGVDSRWMNASGLYVAYSGTGHLTIADGGSVSTRFGYLGAFPGGNGTVTVEGAESQLTNSQTLDIGRYGIGHLTITNGGTVSNTDARLGEWASGNGTVTVDGTGSSWTSTGSVYVGGRADTAAGTGTIDIRDEGTMDVSQTLKLWQQATINLKGGTLRAATIDHREGGQLNFTGGMLQMGSFLGDLVNEGGTLPPGLSTGVTIVQGDYTQAADGRLLIELAGTVSGSEYDTLGVTGLLSLAGTLEVDLLDGFMPEAGDSFQVLFFDQISGEFDHLLLPTLTPGLVWDTDALYTTGTIMAIPEPASLALLGLGGLALLRRRR